MSYVAVLLLCSTPASISCEMKANPNSFQSLEACLAEVTEVRDYYLQQGVYAVGNCVEVNIGEPV